MRVTTSAILLTMYGIKVQVGIDFPAKHIKLTPLRDE